MTRAGKVALAAATAVFSAIVAGVAITYRAPPTENTSLIGAVLRQASDARSQTPIADADITAVSGLSRGQTKSDVAGFYRLTLSPGVKTRQPVTLHFQRAGYQPLAITEPPTSRIYIARLVPIPAASDAEPHGPDIVISDLRVRYSVKATATVNIGSFAKTFEVVNTGDVPCNGHAPCSPDGKWKAASASVSYDAGDDDEFRDVRVSCIAGPCPFTTDKFSNLGKTVKVSALNWSDTTAFLVEAEVNRTQASDTVRYLIPVVFGNGMNFTLPGTAEGPSVQADLNGSDIVFPLGPDILLSWAACTLKANADGSKLYRCQLKPGYQFR